MLGQFGTKTFSTCILDIHQRNLTGGNILFNTKRCAQQKYFIWVHSGTFTRRISLTWLRFHVRVDRLQKLGESSCVCRKNVFPGFGLVRPLFSKRVASEQFRKPGHFANSCSRSRAVYEDFIAIVLPIQRSLSWGGPRIVSYWQRSRGGGLITCAPTPLGNSDLHQRDRHDQKSDSLLPFPLISFGLMFARRYNSKLKMEFHILYVCMCL